MNTQIENKQVSVVKYTTTVDQCQDKKILRAIDSLKDIIPGILNFKIGYQTFVNASEASSHYPL